MLKIAQEKSPTLYSIAIFVIHSCFTEIFFSLKINLLDGLPSVFYKETCTAGAGTMLLEFGILSRLLGDPVFENLARKAVAALWKNRSRETGLLGKEACHCYHCSRLSLRLAWLGMSPVLQPNLGPISDDIPMWYPIPSFQNLHLAFAPVQQFSSHVHCYLNWKCQNLRLTISLNAERAILKSLVLA